LAESGRSRWPLVGVGIVIVAAVTKNAKKRARRAREAYRKEVAAGARPIQAVGTAVAAFIGV
jgi:hypothetical protein